MQRNLPWSRTLSAQHLSFAWTGIPFYQSIELSHIQTRRINFRRIYFHLVSTLWNYSFYNIICHLSFYEEVYKDALTRNLSIQWNGVIIHIMFLYYARKFTIKQIMYKVGICHTLEQEYPINNPLNSAIFKPDALIFIWPAHFETIHSIILYVFCLSMNKCIRMLWQELCTIK